MSTHVNSSNDSQDASVIVALGLIGAGVAVGAGAILRDPARRESCARFLREVGLPQIGREIATGILLKIAASITGHDSIGGGR